MSTTRNTGGAALLGAALAIVLFGSSPAAAYEWTRTLQEGDSGADVKALQIRVAGWFPRSDQRTFPLDGVFSAKTTKAVQAFQSFYGLTADGVAGQETFDMLNSLEDADGSTIHFEFSEFKQKRNERCSAQANAYSGTFSGGMVSKITTKRNVKRLMWRLEALRAKGGGNPIGVNSGFRSVSYNDCIGGARSSQHMYGTAADNRMAEASNRLERDLAKASQFHGIGCYSSLSHNHFDLRIDNKHLASARFWWWPDRDSHGRDLDEGGKPCWGETDDSSQPRSLSGVTVMRAVRGALPGAGSLIPSVQEIESFQAAGEPDDLGAAD